MTSTANNIDEFGRDLSLKKENSSTCNNPSDFLERFKGMSWAEIEWTIEEEEEEEKKKVETEELRKKLAERKELYKKGKYELEEGEELDL
jgi:hypothetical protein